MQQTEEYRKIKKTLKGLRKWKNYIIEQVEKEVVENGLVQPRAVFLCSDMETGAIFDLTDALRETPQMLNALLKAQLVTYQAIAVMLVMETVFNDSEKVSMLKKDGSNVARSAILITFETLSARDTTVFVLDTKDPAKPTIENRLYETTILDKDLSRYFYGILYTEVPLN